MISSSDLSLLANNGNRRHPCLIHWNYTLQTERLPFERHTIRASGLRDSFHCSWAHTPYWNRRLTQTPVSPTFHVSKKAFIGDAKSPFFVLRSANIGLCIPQTAFQVSEWKPIYFILNQWKALLNQSPFNAHTKLHLQSIGRRVGEGGAKQRWTIKMRLLYHNSPYSFF